VKLEWCLNCIEKALELLEEGLKAFPDCAKLWMMKGQILEQEGKLDEARDVYTHATKKCPDSIPLWILLANIEERRGQLTRARSALDKARLRNPQNDRLWLESVRIEVRAEKSAEKLGQKLDIAGPLLAKGTASLQAFFSNFVR
jgi:pre-mRNA-processing factor 6